MTQYGANLSHELPGYSQYVGRLRGREMKATSRALMAAAVCAIVRAAIVPWYMHFNSPVRVRSSGLDVDIVLTSVVCMTLFVLCAMWARFAPIAAALFALGGFICLCARDYMTYPDLLDQGPIYKLILGVVLIRGFMSAVMSKTI
jgi:hypothetical protein